MKKIAIVHKGKAYIPEARVYQDLLSQYGFQVAYCRTNKELAAENYDVEWHIMGADLPSFSKKDRFVIHEYLSLSVPPMARLKNQMKKLLNRRPNLRIFNGAAIQSELDFQDEVRHIIRNPGLSKDFFVDGQSEKAHDFVYLGAMDRRRNIPVFFDWVCWQLPGSSILAIGTPPPVADLSKRYPNIHFVGQVSHNEIPALLRTAEYGLNLMPDLYPYHLQPSYKLIEYCAAGLKVITTDYLWANQFEEQHQARFFKLNRRFDNLHLEALSRFPFVTPDVSQLTWEHSFRQSGLLDLLLSIH